MRIALHIVERGNGAHPEIRCPQCGKKLGETIEHGGRHRIECARCKQIVEFQTWPDEYDSPEPPQAPAVVERIR